MQEASREILLICITHKTYSSAQAPCSRLLLLIIYHAESEMESNLFECIKYVSQMRGGGRDLKGTCYL